MKKFIICFTLSIIVSIMCVNFSLAEETTTDSSKPIVSFTPRVWYMMQNVNSYNNSTTNQYSTQQLNMVMYGGTISIAPRSFQSTDFLFTVLHGTGSAISTSVSTGSGSDKTDQDRTDFEFLVRHRLGESNANIFYGARYVIWNNKKTMIGPGTYDVTGTNTHENDGSILYPEVGVGYTTNITKDGMNRLFGNITVGYGYAWEEAKNPRPGYTGETKNSWSTYLIDINAGYEFVLNKYFAAHARYRCSMMKVSDPSENYMLVLHGPEVGIKGSF